MRVLISSRRLRDRVPLPATPYEIRRNVVCIGTELLFCGGQYRDSCLIASECAGASRLSEPSGKFGRRSHVSQLHSE